MIYNSTCSVFNGIFLIKNVSSRLESVLQDESPILSKVPSGQREYKSLSFDYLSVCLSVDIVGLGVSVKLAQDRILGW